MATLGFVTMLHLQSVIVQRPCRLACRLCTPSSALIGRDAMQLKALPLLSMAL